MKTDDNEEREAISRLLDYHGWRYWLANGWCIRFRVKEIVSTAGRPVGIKYAFTLHDVDMTRLMGIDNAHGIPHHKIYDHKHCFRRRDVAPYEYQGQNRLICDFFDGIERIFQREDLPFLFEERTVEVEEEDGDEIS